MSIRENRRYNRKWTIQRHKQHIGSKTQKCKDTTRKTKNAHQKTGGQPKCSRRVISLILRMIYILYFRSKHVFQTHSLLTAGYIPANEKRGMLCVSEYLFVPKMQRIVNMSDIIVCLWCLTPLSTIFQLYRGGGNHRPVANH